MRIHVFGTVVGIFALVITLGFSMNISADEGLIPNWIKNTALWYGQGNISDADFISAMQFLIDQKMLKIPSSGVSPEYLDEYKKWARDEISKYEQYADNLKDEIKRLENENHNLKSKLQESQNKLVFNEKVNDRLKENQKSQFEKKLSEISNILTEEEKKPQTTITEQKINWRVADSKGNLYYWTMPIESYESLVASEPYLEYLYFEMPSGKTVNVIDHTKFVGTSFTNVIDEVYENSSSDTEFIYEVWYITSQLTTYSYDIGEYPRYALETLSRGGGDCEDTAILIADMLRSSKYTSNWTIQLVYFDSDHPESPKEVNHVAVAVDTGKNNFVIESTAKDENTMNAWVGENIFGWWYDV